MSTTDSTKETTITAEEPTKAPSPEDNYCCYLGDDAPAFAAAAPGPERMALGCQASADFTVYGESGRPDDSTQSCADHLGKMVDPIGTSTVERVSA